MKNKDNSEGNRIGFRNSREAGNALIRFIWQHMRVRRLVSAWLDIFVINAPLVLIMQIVMKLYEWRGFGTKIEGFKVIFDNPVFAAILLLIFMIKDIVRSPGKRIMKLKLIAADGSNPHFWKRALRNVTMLVGYIEVIAILISGRRITDWILGLNVVDAEEE